MPSAKINRWFEENKRIFPWRVDPSPYRVWISEVMLQQTRAQVVIPYFEAWMAQFPDVQTLANATLEQVIKRWEGLGYYSRARNLHSGAQQMVRDFGGQVPVHKEDLMKIRGLGPYTVAAILSFGFNKRAAAVDGNVLRVITRYAWIDQDILKVATKRKVTQFVEEFLDSEKPWVTSEALIELGATICTPAPRCEICPLHLSCEGFKRGQATFLPIKSSKQKTEKLARGVAVVICDGYVLMRQNLAGKVMADLCEFPYFADVKTFKKVQGELAKLGLHVQYIQSFELVKHSFTRFSALLYPFYFQALARTAIEGYTWIPLDQLDQMPFSAGHRNIKIQLASF